MADFDISQVRALEVSLGKASLSATLKASQAVRKSALDLRAQAATRAPIRTGALRSSITADISALEATVGPTVHYGVYLEYGTRRMAARPYLGPAFDAVQPGFLDAVAQIAGSVLDD